MEPHERVLLSFTRGRSDTRTRACLCLGDRNRGLDELQERVPAHDFPKLVGRISFFVNAGIRFVRNVQDARFVDAVG